MPSPTTSARPQRRSSLARRIPLAIVASAVATVMLARPAISETTVPGDIDGDGRAELIIGVPQEDLEAIRGAGLVHVLRGAPEGVTDVGGMAITQAGAIVGVPETDDHFGGSVELADVNGDGHADALIGTPGEAIGATGSSGLVTVVYGGPGGLVVTDNAAYAQGDTGRAADELGDFFGWDTAAGDFDGDGFDDIAVSAPFEDIGPVVDAGGVMVLYGSAGGVDLARTAYFSQAGSVYGIVERSDFFGWALAVGDFNGDGRDDLAVGIPGEDVGDIVDAGAVTVIYGSSTGLRETGTTGLVQGGPVIGVPEADDVFGFAVAGSDVDCDGIDDLIVGTPNEDLDEVINAGVVSVFRGTSTGVTTAGNTLLRQGAAGVAGQLGNNLSGQVLAAGDLDGDGCGDLVFGSPVEDVGATPTAGTATAVFGSPAWPTNGGSQQIRQGQVAGVPEPGDGFGGSLAIADYNGDGADDVAIGVPQEGIGTIPRAGAVVVVLGGNAGLQIGSSRLFSQDGPVFGVPEPDDGFASSLRDGSF